MAPGPPAPSAPSARPRPVPPARPGALLSAAAAVPLGIAVLYASGWLAWGPRLALGLAVVVLANALRGTVGTVTGARISEPVARAVGLGFLVGGLLVAIGAGLTALGVSRAPAADESGSGGALGGTLALVAIPVVGLVLSTLGALWTRRDSGLRGAQRAAAACAVLAGIGVLVLSDRVAASAVLGSGEPVLDSGTAVVAVLLMVALALGSVLLAVSGARRPSPVAAVGVVAGTAAVALWAATLSVATATGIDPTPTDHGVGALVLRPLDLLLGFGDPGRLLHAAEPGWPVLFGVVGLVLLGAAVGLESRRPLPASTPVAAIAPDDD